MWQRRLRRTYQGPARGGPRARPPVRLPSVVTRVAIIGGLLFVVVGVLILRLWFLQVLDSQQYLAQAENNSERTVEIAAPRGTIEDCHGVTFVDNRPGLSIGIRPMDVPPGQLKAVAARLTRLVHVPAKTILTLVARQSWLPYDLVIVKRGASKPVVSYLLEHDQSFPGVEVSRTTCGPTLLASWLRRFSATWVRSIRGS